MSVRYILTLSCPDVRGIVASVSRFLADNYGFILESGQYGDESTKQFFMRVEFATEEGAPDFSELRKRFQAHVANIFAMHWEMVDNAKKTRTLVMVSKYSHCLNDLLYRASTNQLAIEIPAIISNHRDLEPFAKTHHIPFYYLPANNKTEQEAQIMNLIEQYHIDVIVLARYMQILSPSLCKALEGRAINIHHSFLPSFKGAKPYQQAYARGVKIIGATAHFVTDDLDEGPIIEQEIARVDHAHSPGDLTSIGRDIECQVLARALKFYSEHRVLLNGKKTVIFR